MSTKGPKIRNHLGWPRNCGAMAALYITWRRLMTVAVATRASQVVVPARLTVANWAAPAKISTDVDHATAVGMTESLMATPSTSANGSTGAYRGVQVRTASRRTGSIRRGYGWVRGRPTRFRRGVAVVTSGATGLRWRRARATACGQGRTRHRRCVGDPSGAGRRGVRPGVARQP